MATNDPKPIPPLTPSDISRFWKYVDVRGPDECWPWKAGTTACGYGQLSVRCAPNKSVRIYTHRIALLLFLGYDPWPLDSCHTCDNPPCCNGKHLFPGTHQDNMSDAASKGHMTGANLAAIHEQFVGSKHGNASFTPEQIYEIAKMWNAGHTQRAIASYFGAWPFSISLILRGKAYKAELANAVEQLGEPIKDFHRRPWDSGTPKKVHST